MFINSLSSSADSVISILIDRLIARLLKSVNKEALIIIKLIDKWYKIKQALDQQRCERDRAAGLETSKKKEKASIAAQQHQAERTFIAEIARVAGWSEKDLHFDDEAHAHLSPRAYQEARRQHHQQLLKQANAFVQAQVARIVADPEHLKQALGETPLTAPENPATLTVDDLNPVKPPDAGRGFAPAYGKRAAEHTPGGVTALQDEVAEIKNQRPELQRRMIENRQKTAQSLKDELKNQRPSAPPPVSNDAVPMNQVLGLLKQQKALKHELKLAQQARQKVDEATNLEEIKAYNIEVGGRPVEDDEILQDVQDQLRTAQTRALLAEVKKISAGQFPEQALSRHLGAGAQAAIDAPSLTVTGQNLIDRSVVDVLGMEGAARALAHRLRATLDASEMETLYQALSDYTIYQLILL